MCIRYTLSRYVGYTTKRFCFLDSILHNQIQCNSFYCKKIFLIISIRVSFLLPAFRIHAVKTISYYSLFKESLKTMISCDLSKYMYEFSIILQIISILYNKVLFLYRFCIYCILQNLLIRTNSLFVYEQINQTQRTRVLWK